MKAWSPKRVLPSGVTLCVLLICSGVLLGQSRPVDEPAAQEPPEAPPASQPVVATADDEQTPTSTPVEEPETSEAALRLFSGLVGGKHDFTKGGLEGRGLCLPCHVPHLVDAPTPLLDRRTATTQPLRPYQTPGAELNGWSLLCLGCHDGVTAKAVYSSPHATTITSDLTGWQFGAAGVRSHPVGIKYPLPAAMDKYNPPAAVEAAGLPLPEGRIQCTTCHDAHNTDRHPGMTRISNERSRLCLTCHRL